MGGWEIRKEGRKEGRKERTQKQASEESWGGEQTAWTGSLLLVQIKAWTGPLHLIQSQNGPYT